jgi:hypothetical protein
VSELELRPDGRLAYTMTATALEQVELMKNAGMPLSTESRKPFHRVSPPTRLAYLSLIDFVPDHEPYEHLAVVDITSASDRTDVVMTVDPMHDETWTPIRGSALGHPAPVSSRTAFAVFTEDGPAKGAERRTCPCRWRDALGRALRSCVSTCASTAGLVWLLLSVAAWPRRAT